MPREAALQDDAAAKEGTIVSHRWVAGNTAVPFLYGYDEQLKTTVEFLKADKLNVDLFALERRLYNVHFRPSFLEQRSVLVEQ